MAAFPVVARATATARATAAVLALAAAGCGFGFGCGCGSSTSDAPRAAPDPWSIDAAATAPRAARCERQTFAEEIALAEASGADWVPADALRPAHVLVVGDSGNAGAFVAIDAESGVVLAGGRLPLDRGATDDLEGLAVSGDDVYAITSSGWMRRWRRDADDWGFTLADAAYPLAAPGAGDGLVCTIVNCGMNYEGLCLRDDAVGDGECAGFAAAKAAGRLYCLIRDDAGRLRIDGARWIQVSAADTLTSCDFAPDGDVLWAGTNAFDAATVYQIRGWRDPARGEAVVEPIDRIGRGFPESMAVGPGGVVYRFSDTGGAPSLEDRYLCK